VPAACRIIRRAARLQNWPTTGCGETSAISRGLRIEYPGAIYHVTSRGNRGGDIVIDDQDRHDFWGRVRETVIRFRGEMYAAALLTNYFHLFFRTLDANLSCGMQWLLSDYAQTLLVGKNGVKLCLLFFDQVDLVRSSGPP